MKGLMNEQIILHVVVSLVGNRALFFSFHGEIIAAVSRVIV